MIHVLPLKSPTSSIIPCRTSLITYLSVIWLKKRFDIFWARKFLENVIKEWLSSETQLCEFNAKIGKREAEKENTLDNSQKLKMLAAYSENGSTRSMIN